MTARAGYARVMHKAHLFLFVALGACGAAAQEVSPDAQRLFALVEARAVACPGGLNFGAGSTCAVTRQGVEQVQRAKKADAAGDYHALNVVAPGTPGWAGPGTLLVWDAGVDALSASCVTFDRPQGQMQQFGPMCWPRTTAHNLPEHPLPSGDFKLPGDFTRP